MNGLRRIVAGAAAILSISAASLLAQVPDVPRVAPLAEPQWNESLRALISDFDSTGMRNLAATYANRAEVAEASLPHLEYLWTGSLLPPRDRALLTLRTAWLTGSEYLWAHRAGLALREGLSRDDLARIAAGPNADGWTRFDRLLLLAADEMHVDSFIADATWAGLSERYSTAQMIDTIDTAGALTMHAGAANSLGVQIEAGVTERFPSGLPRVAAAERTNIRLIDKAPRIPPRPPADGGPVTANVFNTFNHNPPGDSVRGQINRLVNNRMSLEPPDRELLLIRIGVLTRSEYEYAAHMRVGLRVGLTEADIQDILAGPEAAEDPLKAALLRATDELYEDDVISDATWNELAATLSTGQMLDVLFAVGGYRSNSILISTAGVQLDANMADFRFPPELRDPPSPDCRDEQGLTYICDLVVPEDILAVGSTGLLLVSGHRAPGHLYLIDPVARTQSELIHSATFALQHDTRAYPDCPGPLNLEAFDTHGLSLTETSPRHFSLYTTSHGEREAIEIYDLDFRGAAPALTWKGCVLLQQDSYHNSVARLADGGFVATRMRDQTWRAGGAPAGITGWLIEWHPGGQLQRLAGTELSLPNGIDVSEDERYVYVAAIGSHEIVRFDRRATPMAKRAVSLPIRPDNVHWGPNGKLLTAGPNYVAPEVCSGAGCATGWSVLEVDPETLTFSRLGGADQTAAMQAVSSAMRMGDDIWVGSNDDRVARFSLPRL